VVTPSPRDTAQHGDALGKRLRPLYIASFFQSLALWVPIEKLFMTSIGFTAASIGVMAAVYAVIVPVLEVPSGIMADRWSRRGVLVLASAAAIVSVVVGGLSQSIPAYMVSAAFLGVFFALQSGTFESVVYDTVLEETGDSEAFERKIGRVRIVESIALVTGALAGGAIAQIAPLQATYFLTAPLLVVAGATLFLFREPKLHKSEEPLSLREQVATTYRTLLRGGHLRLVVLLTIAGSLLMQGMLEFGPLWLVALLVPPFLYGPHWAGLTGALGLGGMLGTQSWITSPSAVRILGVAVVACGVVLAVSQHALVVVAVQVLLTLLVVAISIPVSRSLHDAIPSGIRAGVASGVGTLTWLAFVPFALVVGAVSEGAGIDRAAWLFVAIGIAAAVLMLTVLPAARPVPAEAAVEIGPAPAVDAPAFSPDRFLPPDDPEWPGHWAVPPNAWTASGIDLDRPAVRELVRAAIAEMPARLRQVIVLRDIEGRSTDQVGTAVGIDPAELRAMLDQARARIRTRLEQHLEEAGAARE
jgi:MFS family permease